MSAPVKYSPDDKRWGKRAIGEARLQRYERKIEKAIKSALNAQKEKALSTLRTQHLSAAAPPDAFDINTWDTKVLNDVKKVIDKTLREAADDATTFFDLPPVLRAKILGQIDLTNQAETFAQRVQGIGIDTQDQLFTALQKGIARGESIDQLATRVGKVFDSAESSAETIARTETHGAASETTYLSASAISDAGFKVTKEWVCAHDMRTREWHRKADGQAVDVQEPFVVDGEELMFPGDRNGSAENVINCRCAQVFDMPE